jgi:hypothetical protein
MAGFLGQLGIGLLSSIAGSLFAPVGQKLFGSGQPHHRRHPLGQNSTLHGGLRHPFVTKMRDEKQARFKKKEPPLEMPDSKKDSLTGSGLRRRGRRHRLARHRLGRGAGGKRMIGFSHPHATRHHLHRVYHNLHRHAGRRFG